MPRILESWVKDPTRAEALFPDLARCGRFGEQFNSLFGIARGGVRAGVGSGAVCGAENSPASMFCEDCGSALAVNAPADAHSPQTGSTDHNIRVTPEQPATSTATDGERKTITLLFADIKGSMDLMEDPL